MMTLIPMPHKSIITTGIFNNFKIALLDNIHLILKASSKKNKSFLICSKTSKINIVVKNKKLQTILKRMQTSFMKILKICKSDAQI